MFIPYWILIVVVISFVFLIHKTEEKQLEIKELKKRLSNIQSSEDDDNIDTEESL